MKIRLNIVALALGILFPILAGAQAGFDVRGHEVQIHGFLSEGFAASTDNNYLRMDTTNGGFFTELGLNITLEVSDKLRVGAQGYQRQIGELGKGKVYLDWASADFRWKDWLGVRGGKVKTSFGLYTDTQDHEFLHTWALLPQSVYPMDLRSVTVGHVGADIYGDIDVKSGTLSYTVFTGTLPHDPRGGFVYGIEAQGLGLRSEIDGRMTGADLRWNSSVPGLMVGASQLFGRGSFDANQGASPVPLSYSGKTGRTTAVYGRYTLGNFEADVEYRYQKRRAEIVAEVPGRPVVRRPGSNEPSWFVSGAYRPARWLEVGSYYSHYRVTLINPVTPVTGPGRDHIYDRAIAVRFDPTRFWDVKVEGHFMNGVGSPAQARGFYPQDNRQGLVPTTNMLVIRTGLYF